MATKLPLVNRVNVSIYIEGNYKPLIQYETTYKPYNVGELITLVLDNTLQNGKYRIIKCEPRLVKNGKSMNHSYIYLVEKY